AKLISDQLNSKGFGKYKKNRTDIFSILRPYLSDAIRHAKALKASHNDDAPSKNTPGTQVFEIFDNLQPYLNTDETAS
ncbi:MAG: hypothetical protein FWG38_07660, partial [Defluviitaleaceae bacterium]|nr:hypothetical protein [Defluviitaleaceae bacterium]